MNLDLTDHEAAALLKELNGLIDGDRYFLSDRIKTLKAIRAKMRPEPARAASAAAAEALRPAAGDYGEQKALRALKPDCQPDLLITPPGTATHIGLGGSGLAPESPVLHTGVLLSRAGTRISPRVWATSHRSGQP